MKAPRRRGRDAAATRAELLRQAAAAFAGGSYEGVGLRRIAAAVGVDPSLVIRYFGSKEALYREAIRSTEKVADPVELVAGGRARIGLRVARALTSPEIRESLMLTLRAATSAKASSIAAQRMREAFAEPLEALLGDADAGLRADLVDSLLLGAAIGYWLFEFDSMRRPDAERFIALTGRAVQAVIDAPPPRSGPRTRKGSVGPGRPPTGGRSAGTRRPS